MLSSTQAEIVDQMLQGVIQGGTGTAAALPGREVAGKTGTTENYGDAWFVGFTPQLVAAVWVGYPDKLVPMTTEFHGQPVAGGTYPALIWKAFMTKALAYLKAEPEDFPAPPPLVRLAGDGREPKRRARARQRCLPEHVPTRVLRRGPSGHRSRLATCKPNEVEIPDVVGEPLAAARARLEGQPLTAPWSTSLRRPGTASGTSSGSSPSRERRRPTTRSR